MVLAEREKPFDEEYNKEYIRMIKRTKLQFDMDEGIRGFLNEIRRGKGHLPSYFWNRIQWNYFHKFNIVPKFPLNVDIEVSSKCNLRCDHCFRQYLDIKENDFMPFDLYKKVVDECSYYKLFTLKVSMRGEPTLCPDIVEMIDYAKRKGIRETWINTHGGTLTEKMAKGLIMAKLDLLTISFDGIGEMYNSIRIPLKYEETLEKVKKFMAVREKLGAKKPLVKVQTLWSAIKDNPEEYLEIMGNIVDKVSYNIDMDFKDTHFVPDPNYICYRLWQRIAVTSHGDILKCPSDFQKEQVLGNVKDKSIKEIWDTKQQRHREFHLAKKRVDDPVCKKCHHGALTYENWKDYAGKHQEVSEIKYRDGFEGVGLHRKR